jgi:hypothetical protein
MTEEEWLTSESLGEMWAMLGHSANERKLRLFATITAAIQIRFTYAAAGW